MFTLAGWYESIDNAAAFGQIAAMPDQHVFVSGDLIRVPQEMSNIIGETALTAATVAVTQARISSPSLRQISNLDIEPFLSALVFGSPPEVSVHPLSPIPVDAFESLDLQCNTDHAAAIGHYGFVLLSDGPQLPVSGRMYSIRATSAVTLSVGTWVNGALTFAQTLPVGTYQIVGMRARGTNLVAARLVFIGGINRPGVFAVNAIGDHDVIKFRHGGMGIYGQFHTNTPPTVDCVGVTDSAQQYIFDVIRVG